MSIARQLAAHLADISPTPRAELRDVRRRATRILGRMSRRVVGLVAPAGAVPER